MSIMPRTTTATSKRPAWKSHPLYRLRLALLITDAIGALLALFSIPTFDPWNTATPIFDVLFLSASIAFVLWDLITFSSSQTSTTPQSLPHHTANNTRDDNDPKSEWPRRALLIWDLVLALLLQWMFWGTLATLGHGYSIDVGGIVLQSWVSLAVFAASVLHAKCFWKELMARKERGWARGRAREPCARCGFEGRDEEEEVGVEGEDVAAAVRGLNDSVKQKLARFLRRERAADRDVEETEESLLITPDESGASTQKGYGGLGEAGGAMEASEERVVKKKGKARAVDA